MISRHCSLLRLHCNLARTAILVSGAPLRPPNAPRLNASRRLYKESDIERTRTNSTISNAERIAWEVSLSVNTLYSHFLRPALEQRVYSGPIRLLRLSHSSTETGIDVRLQSRREIVEDIIQAFRRQGPGVEYDRARLAGSLSWWTKYAVLSHRWASDAGPGHRSGAGAGTGATELTYEETMAMRFMNFQESNARLNMLPGPEPEPEPPLPASGVFSLLPQDKIIQFCQKALNDYRCRYAWFDSGCIDQRSSAELTESIQSMFQWYRNADVCIVHLGSTSDRSKMEEDQWFRRGWTLQELLAPRRIKFFDMWWRGISEEKYDFSTWRYDGDDVADDPNPAERAMRDTARKTPLPGSILDLSASQNPLRVEGEPLLVSEVQDKVVLATKIDRDRPGNFKPGPQKAREVISWMVNRRTSRPEDRAYCLLGLLDIHLPIAYGEGFHKAFYRLQAEIMSKVDDRGLFLWSARPSPGVRPAFGSNASHNTNAASNSLLASDPETLATSPVGPAERFTADVLYRSPSHATGMSSDAIDQSMTLTNTGLRMQATIYDVYSVDVGRSADAGVVTIHAEHPVGAISAQLMWSPQDEDATRSASPSFDLFNPNPSLFDKKPSQWPFVFTLTAFTRSIRDADMIGEYVQFTAEMTNHQTLVFDLDPRVRTPHLKICVLGRDSSRWGQANGLWAIVVRKDDSRVPPRYSRVIAINPFPMPWPEGYGPLRAPERIYVM